MVSCSIILCWLWLGFRGLSPYSFGILFHHHFRVRARVGSGACLPIFLVSCSIIISWFRLGFRACLRTLFASCSIIISWFRLGFRGLSPYFFGILFHHHFLVVARVPGLVSVLFWHPVPSSFPGSGYGSGACLPIFWVSCSIIISWFRLGFRALSPFFLASCSIIISRFRLGFRGLSPYFFGILFHYHFLVSAGVPGLVSLFFWNPIPSSFLGSGWGLSP